MALHQSEASTYLSIVLLSFLTYFGASLASLPFPRPRSLGINAVLYTRYTGWKFLTGATPCCLLCVLLILIFIVVLY